VTAKPNLLPVYLGAGMLIFVGLVLLGCMVWISGWPRDGVGASAYFVHASLPGYRFKPEILPRLGEVGGGALGLGLTALLIASVLARRSARAR
jgi:hypothetical protein